MTAIQTAMKGRNIAMTEDRYDRKEYDVTIEAVVRKTIRVKADSEDEATELAHGIFHTEHDHSEPETYNEECVGVEEVKS
jgi:hypothetical protein